MLASSLFLSPERHSTFFSRLPPRSSRKFPKRDFGLSDRPRLRTKCPTPTDLKQMIEASPLRGRALLVGFQPEARAWISAMDVIVQPSVTIKSFGMALAEAQALGRPVIASRIGGMPEVVSEGVTGLVVPPGNATCTRSGDVDIARRSGTARRFRQSRHGGGPTPLRSRCFSPGSRRILRSSDREQPTEIDGSLRTGAMGRSAYALAWGRAVTLGERAAWKTRFQRCSTVVKTSGA